MEKAYILPNYVKLMSGDQIFMMGKFFAHLSRRLIGELIVYPWSGVRPSTFSNIFSSETAWPIKAKFYVEPPWVGEMKVC